MTKKVKQKNYEGSNIGNDYVGGDKVNALFGKIIGENIVNNFHFAVTSRVKLSKEDEKKFRDYIQDDRISEFRNLIERIEFSVELFNYEEAIKFVEEANRIYHNHPILLVLHGLCDYALLDKLEVIKYPSLIAKTVKLFEKAREVDKDLGSYRQWNIEVANHFYEILSKNIEQIRKHAPSYFSVRKVVEYYKVIAKHLIHLENCFMISDKTSYLKEFVLHLCGHKNYAWFNLSGNGDIIDLGLSIFEDGAKGQLNKLIFQIREIEPEYNPPELKYGYYFDNPENKSERNFKNKRMNLIIFIACVLGIVLLISVIYFSKIALNFKIILFIYPLLIWGLSHQFGSRLSVFQIISKFIYDKIREYCA